MHIHIIGICGTFMAGIAVLAKDLGYKVLPGLYATCNPDSDLCWQNIAATTDKIFLPHKSIN